MGNLGFEIVVIGAGPAGSRTARQLAESGFSVLLLEKRLLPPTLDQNYT